MICALPRSAYLHTTSSRIHFPEAPPPLKEHPQRDGKIFMSSDSQLPLKSEKTGWSQVSAPPVTGQPTDVYSNQINPLTLTTRIKNG